MEISKLLLVWLLMSVNIKSPVLVDTLNPLGSCAIDYWYTINY